MAPEPAVDPGSDAAVAALAGRWVALVERDGAKALASCGHPHTVEVRSDGMGGWEWVLDRGDELRTATIERAEATATGLRLTVDAGPDQPTALNLVWVERDRTATFDLAGAELFVAPDARDAFPAEVCAPE